MRKLVFALLLLCSALFATAQEWQWSVQLKGFISSRTRRKFSAFLVRGTDGKVGFEFEKKEPKTKVASDPADSAKSSAGKKTTTRKKAG